jgi:hypothetical protein
VTQVVGGHLALEALRGEQERSAHDAGVAEQGREVVVAVEQRLGAARDLVEVGQVLDPEGLQKCRFMLQLGGIRG